MSTRTPQIQLANPVAGVAEHRHCEVCGKSIALDGRVCSPECAKRLQEAIKTKKRSVYILMGVVFLTVVFSLYGNQIFQLGK
ncbi:MAG: DUF2116 family Zn-ribbon domain-containing protein [Thermoplasmatota archaeon]